MPFVNGIGPLEIIIVLVIALLVFGPKRLPELGRSLGRGMREFKESVSGRGEHDEPKPEIEDSATRTADAVDQSTDSPLEGEVVHNRKS